MLSANGVKAFAKNVGTDLCGVAPVERFTGAPRGFHPADVFPEIKAVVAFAKRLPEGVFRAHSPVPYTAAGDAILAEVHRLACLIALELERHGAAAVPVPSEPYSIGTRREKKGAG